MKKGWITQELGTLCIFQRGLTYSKKDEVDNSKNVVLRAMNIDLSTNLLNFGELKHISNNVTIPENKKVRKGSLLICTASGSKNHLGKIAFVDEDYDYAFGGFMGLLTPREQIIPRFLFYAMTSEKYFDFIAALADGMNINNLKFDDLKKFRVSFPSQQEQQRIVAILDEAFEGIAKAKANAEQNLKNARELLQSTIRKTMSSKDLDWIETTIGDQFILQRGFDITKSEQNLGEVPVVSSGGIKSYHNISKVSAPGVVTGRKGTLGKVFYLEKDFWPHDTTLWVKDFQGNLPRFVYYFLTVLPVTQMDTGTANPALNRNQIHPIHVSWPPVSQQQTIVHQLNALSAETQRLESIYQRKIAALDELKKSLLHKAFSGEL